MERIGCTTPFRLELDKICTEKNKSLEAYSLFQDVLYNRKEVKDCLYPCHFLINWISPMDSKDVSYELQHT